MMNWFLTMLFARNTTEVTAIGDMRRGIGNLAGALHAYEIAEKARQELRIYFPNSH